jgi:osmotically-inducible protein OsmY
VTEATEDPYYLAARIQRRLTEDPDTAELGVRVSVHGGEVYLSGDVASELRRRHVIDAATAEAGGLTVRDDLAVTAADAPTTAEDLR